MKNLKNWCLVAGGCLFAVGLMSNAAHAYDSSDTRVPSPTYRSTSSVTYANGAFQLDSFFDVFADFQRAPGPPLSQGQHADSFFDVFADFSLSGGGLPPGIRESPSHQTMRLNGLPPGTPYIGYDTEMLQLDIQGGQLPPGVMIRESPTKQSLGQIHMTDAGGGLYHIDSFFDVFTELSLDGGASWIPSDGGGSPGAALHINGGVPEPSSAVLALLSAVALSRFGFRRRKG
jgi:hypothetical protein